MDECVHGCNEWVARWVNGWMDEWTIGQLGGWLGRYEDE